MSQLVNRAMVHEDVLQVWNLETSIFGGDATTEEEIIAAYRKGNSSVCVTKDGRIVGVLMVNVRNSDTYYAEQVHTVISLCVDPDFQRQGIARSLLRRATDAVHHTMYLHVRVSNFPAYALYVSHGFTHVRTLINYYSLPDGTLEDAVYMSREYIHIRDESVNTAVLICGIAMILATTIMMILICDDDRRRKRVT